MDDCLMFTKDDQMIANLCSSLLTEFLLKEEGSIENFLGINVDHKLSDNGSITITMTQMGLIDQIIKDVGLVAWQ